MSESEFRSLQMQARLAEYNSLRTESLSAIANRATVANFSFGALAVLIAAILSQGRPNWPTAIVCAFFVPQIAKAGLAIWLGEYERSQRAGKRLSDVETAISEIAGATVMCWESRLVQRNLHMAYPYVATALLLLGAGYVSGGVGLFLLFVLMDPAIPLWGRVAVLVVPVAVVVATEWGFLRFFRAKWQYIRLNYSSRTDDSPFEESNV